MTITLTREEAQQVLDALQELNKLSLGENAICLPAEIDNAMETIRARLAQPEPEPVAWRYKIGQSTHHDEYLVSIKQPNNIYSVDGGGIRIDNGEPLYTAPPQREWQGLTDEEKSEIYNRNYNLYAHDMHIGDFFLIQQAIEAKLKEKNT
jgi:hypothetical protein